MKIKDFEKKIQTEIDKDLTIRTNPNHDDIAGVYWNDVYIGVSLPPVDIREDIDLNYVDAIGQPYKNVEMALSFIKGKLTKYKREMKDDPKLFEKEEK